MKLILLGAPGSGKGTQAQLICEEFSLPHISSGDIFRYNMSHGTELGKLAHAYIDRGELVPDDVTIKMITERLSREDCQKGYILDGFPRTLSQAADLEAHEKIDAVVELDLHFDVITDRITGRRSCEDCGNPYHISMLDGADKCPACGGKLIAREDDNEATVRKRLDVYKHQTMPLVKFYEDKGLLIKVNGEGDVHKIFEDIKERLYDKKKNDIG